MDEAEKWGLPGVPAGDRSFHGQLFPAVLDALQIAVHRPVDLLLELLVVALAIEGDEGLLHLLLVGPKTVTFTGWVIAALGIGRSRVDAGRNDQKEPEHGEGDYETHAVSCIHKLALRIRI
jgi:hypothetical protein